MAATRGGMPERKDEDATAGFAPLPDPPYHAVIFTSRLGDQEGYAEMAEHMAARAARQPGFIGMESARGADGLGITVSYWRDEAAVLAWKADAEHMLAQKLGRKRWYRHYRLRVALVERAHAGPQGR